MRRGEDNCRVLRGDRAGGERRAGGGQWDGPNHAVSFLHTLDGRTDIAHDNATTMRCGGGEDVLCYGANKARGDPLRSHVRMGVKITATRSEHDEWCRVISLLTLHFGEYPGWWSLVQEAGWRNIPNISQPIHKEMGELVHDCPAAQNPKY